MILIILSSSCVASTTVNNAKEKDDKCIYQQVLNNLCGNKTVSSHFKNATLSRWKLSTDRECWSRLSAKQTCAFEVLVSLNRFNDVRNNNSKARLDRIGDCVLSAISAWRTLRSERAASVRSRRAPEELVCLCMRERSRTRMHVTHNAYRSPRFSPGISIFRFNRRITYLLGTCPGGPRHDGIDYANSRNRPSWLKPLRNYASTPLDWGLSIFVPRIFPSLSVLSRSFNLPLFLSPSLFALRVLPSSFF